MIVLLLILTVVAGLEQYVARTPAHSMASAMMALAGAAVAFAIVYRSRPAGGRGRGPNPRQPGPGLARIRHTALIPGSRTLTTWG